MRIANLGTETNFLPVRDSSGFTSTARAGNWSLSPNSRISQFEIPYDFPNKINGAQ